MASAVNRLLAKFFPKGESTRIVILGNDNSGKTSILYRLKLREFLDNTSPTLGFNVEDLAIQIPGGRTLNTTMWDIGGGCGGGGQWLRVMLPHYMANAEGVVWVVDSTDNERLSESVEALQNLISTIIHDTEAGVGKTNMFPVLILANKTDDPKTLGVEKIREMFSHITKGRLCAVYSVSAKRDIGFANAFGWLKTALDIFRTNSNLDTGRATLQAKSQSTQTAAPQDKSAVPNLRSPSELAQKLESWLVRAENDVSSEEFLRRFESYTLPAWDHYTHIRVAYLILEKYGRQEGKDKIFKGLADYIANSDQARSRAFHLSMTYFWIQIVHFGIRNTPPSTADSRNANELDTFSRFLLVNPHVVDGMLWEDFYSKDVLMSAEARSSMALPDKKPLPNVAIRDAITAFGKTA